MSGSGFAQFVPLILTVLAPATFPFISMLFISFLLVIILFCFHLFSFLLFQKGQFLKTLVKRGSTIGANATILCGIEIGKFSFIGAGSNVIDDVKDYSLAYGNPAKHKSWVSEYGAKLNKKLICPISKKKFKLINKKLKAYD